MKRKVVIIGGGVAGLCAAIRFCELGEKPLVIEGGSYPAHKICGEFLSPESLSVLSQWGIHPVSIPNVAIYAKTASMALPFPSPAGALSHIELDPQLAGCAIKAGAAIMTDTRVISFCPKRHSADVHLIELSNGEMVEASCVIVATGRMPNAATALSPPRYMGFKAHFKNVETEGNLAVYSLPGAYLGIAPIENKAYNIACLAEIHRVNEFATPQIFMDHLISSNAHLKALFSQGEMLFDSWMIGSIPAFGLKKTPPWIDSYFIGDAAAMTPPASGSGLSLGLIGGRLAAEYAVKGKPEEFKSMWAKCCSSQIFWALRLHKILLNPLYSFLLIKSSRYFPSIQKKAYAWTRIPWKEASAFHP